MRRRRLFSRLLWSMFGVGLLSALVVSLIDDRSLAAAASELLERELRSHTAILEVAARGALLGNAPADELQAHLRPAATAAGLRYTVIALEGERGRVLADSDAEPRTLDDHAHRPEIVAARQHGLGVARRYSTSVSGEMIYVARAVHGPEGRCVGFVRAAQPASAFARDVSSGRRQLVIAAGLGTLIAGLLAWWLSRAAAQPIAHVREVANAMAAGAHARAAVTTDDEFGELGRALNTMADRLQERVEEMRGERAKLSAILGGMVEGVAAFDERECALHLNGAAVDILGTGDASVGRPLLEITRIPEICELVSTTLATGAKASREVAVRKGVEARVLQLEAAPLRDRDDDVNGCVLVLHDVTELRRLEGVRRDFVANVSHELKTPLTAIKGMVDTMIDDREMPEDVRMRFLDKVKKQVDRLAMLVSDLLVLGRVESSKVSEELLELDLRQPVRESCNQLTVAAQTKRLRLSASFPDAPVLVRGEAESLRQVVDNLLGNAIRYTPEGGEIFVSVTEHLSEAVITVRDTGIGIEAEHLDRIFERFYRVDKARSRELGGTGLGLAIVKHVALGHGGTVRVQSKPGVGSVFSVCIPRAPDEPERRMVS
jgi:two-component system phosphate regulon sensor histidine kinase PhoR